jgi:hypothetical protein
MRTINFKTNAAQFDVADLSLATGLTISELMINADKHYEKTCKALMRKVVTKDLAKEIFKNIKKGKLTNIHDIGDAFYVMGALSTKPKKDKLMVIKDLLVKYLSIYYNKRQDKYGIVKDETIASLLDVCGETKITVKAEPKKNKNGEAKKQPTVVDDAKAYNKLNKLINLKSIKKDVVDILVKTVGKDAYKRIKTQADSLGEGQRFFYNKKESNLANGILILQGLDSTGARFNIKLELPKASKPAKQQETKKEAQDTVEENTTEEASA